MKRIRKASERGTSNFGWLQAHHSFSFGRYFNRDWNGFGSLRVLNEDQVEPSNGFGMHPHKNMEILTYVLSGEISHEDNLGHTGVANRGVIQYMAAGSGIQHSEWNKNPTDPVHLYQIWITPDRENINPIYKRESIDFEAAAKDWTLLAGPSRSKGLVSINQDAKMFLRLSTAGENIVYDISEGRKVWLQVVKGEVVVADNLVKTGDSIAVEDETILEISIKSDSEMLLFDLN